MTSHITTVTIYPTGTREDPVIFESLDDALNFSRITGRLIWAATRSSGSAYKIYPGGRIVECQPAALRQIAERKARH